MAAMKEGPILAIVCLALVGFLGIKHSRAYLNRVPDMDRIAYADASGQHEWSSDGGSTLLVFFRTGCPSCASSVPAWKELYRESCKDLRFLFLSAEPWEEISASWIADPWEPMEGCEPVTIGRPLDPATLAQKYDIQAVPTHFLVGEDGAVQSILVGAPKEGQATRLFGGTK